MNDQDYIRAGIELADGWNISKGWLVNGPWIFEPLDAFAIHIDKLPDFLKAALAAQLVRQVDALGFLECDIDGGGTSITCPSNDEFSPIRVWGNDRAMNTIKATSKVLK